jgi:hypothetical protein
MQSSRALGVFALCAVILAAIAFAAVDVSVAVTADGTLPGIAIVSAVIGTVALMASIVPAFAWFVRSIEHPHHDADIEPIPVSVTPRTFEDDDL